RRHVPGLRGPTVATPRRLPGDDRPFTSGRESVTTSSATETHRRQRTATTGPTSGSNPWHPLRNHVGAATAGEDCGRAAGTVDRPAEPVRPRPAGGAPSAHMSQ